MASKCISKLAWSQPPSASPNSLDHGGQVHLQNHSITALKCIAKLARLRPPSSHDDGLQVHLQTCSITASKCISILARLWSRSAYLSLLDGDRIWRNTRPWWTTHIAWIYERLARVREDPQIAWIYEARQECMRRRAGKDRVCISYNEMMSIYLGVSQIYTACRWVHLHYPSISVPIYIERHG